MLSGPGFARVAYTMFAVAVLLAVFKLGSSGAEPLFLRTLPAEPVAQRLAGSELPQPPTETPNASEMADEIVEEATGAATGATPPEPTPQNPETALPQSDSLLTEEAEAAGAEAPVEVEAEPRALAGGASAGPRARATSSTGDAPVFYRPQTDGVGSGGSSASALGDATTSGEAVCGDLGDLPESSRAVFPLPDEYFNSYDDTWGAPRSQGGHEGTDLMSPTGTALFAITDGTLVPVSGANGNGWNTLGGYTVMLRADYDVGPIKQGDLFYYAHMDAESSLPIGTRVSAGQQVGVVGDTGQGPEVTRGQFPSHLHLGWYDTSGARTNLPSGAMNPYTLLVWLEENGGAVRGGTDASYCTAPESSAPAPSTGGSSWPSGSYAGETPDLDTGEPDDARPSPVVEETEHNHDHGHTDQAQTAQQNEAGEGHNGGAAGDAAGQAGADGSGSQAAPAGSDKPSSQAQATAEEAVEAAPDASDLAEEVVEGAVGDADGQTQEAQPGAQPEAGATPDAGEDGAVQAGAAAQETAAEPEAPVVADTGNLVDKVKKRVDSILSGITNKTNPEQQQENRARAKAKAEAKAKAQARAEAKAEARAERERKAQEERREEAQERREAKAQKERQKALRYRPAPEEQTRDEAQPLTTRPAEENPRAEQPAPSETGGGGEDPAEPAADGEPDPAEPEATSEPPAEAPAEEQYAPSGDGAPAEGG